MKQTLLEYLSNKMKMKFVKLTDASVFLYLFGWVFHTFYDTLLTCWGPVRDCHVFDEAGDVWGMIQIFVQRATGTLPFNLLPEQFHSSKI